MEIIKRPARGSRPDAGTAPRYHRCVSHRRLVGCKRQAWSNTAIEDTVSNTRATTAHTVKSPSALGAQTPTLAMEGSTRSSDTARQTPKQRTVIWNGGDACMAAAERRTQRRDQMRLNTRVPLVPPKPKLFFTAYSIFMSRAALAQ